jgi:hypothetical protein
MFYDDVLLQHLKKYKKRHMIRVRTCIKAYIVPMEQVAKDSSNNSKIPPPKYF